MPVPKGVKITRMASDPAVRAFVSDATRPAVSRGGGGSSVWAIDGATVGDVWSASGLPEWRTKDEKIDPRNPFVKGVK
jgi:hypothetical protein